MAILPWIGTLQGYLAAGRAKIRSLVDVSACPVLACGDRLQSWGFYQRQVRRSADMEERGAVAIDIPRCRCKRCGKTVQFLPPFVAKWGRWYLDELLEVFERMSVSGESLSRAWAVEAADAMSLSTCYRWTGRVQDCFDRGDAGLQAYVAKVAPDLDVDQELESKPQGRRVWRRTRRWLVTLRAVNRQRTSMQPPKAAMSLGAVVYFLAHERWQRLVT